ncbi:MAG: hypothetical protein ACR2KT_04630 [Methylocella sp.]
MRNRAIRGCLIACIALLIIAFSKDVGSVAKERIHPTDHNKQSQQIPEADKRGTLESPLIVKPLHTDKNEEESADDARDKNEKRWNDRVTFFIGIATGLILLLQLFVFGWQAISLRRTITTMKELGKQQSADMQAFIAIAKESADVARKSVEVFERQTRASIAIERPHILIGKDIAITAVEETTFQTS